MSTLIDKHAELYVQTVEKGSPRFTACNQMQMGPWSLSEGSLYHGKYRFFFLVASTFREMMPAAIAVGNPLSWL